MMTDILTKGEIERLLVALCQEKPDFSDNDALKVVEWARQTRLNHMLLELVLKELVTIDVDDAGQLGFAGAKSARSTP